MSQNDERKRSEAHFAVTCMSNDLATWIVFFTEFSGRESKVCVRIC